MICTAKLKRLEQKSPPTDVAPPRREAKAAHWVKPTLVGEVRFAGWTRDGLLRHPAFIALRSDKPASQIVRELPEAPEICETEQGIAVKNNANLARETSKPAAKSPAGSIAIAGVTLSHPDKLLYPDRKVTKRDVAEYYQAVQEWMLPHVIDRPLALVRCPAGQSAKCFFQRNWSDTLPDSIGKVNIGEGKKKENHVAIHDLAGVISLVQISVLEIHTWNCASSDIEHPDQLIFDLDPGPMCRGSASSRPRARFIERSINFDFPQFLKTSGGKGLHITIPIEPNIEWDSAKGFCETIVKSLAQSSGLFVANMRKDLRGGKSLRGLPPQWARRHCGCALFHARRTGAPVSMPISWEELGKLSSAAHFTVETARRLSRKAKDRSLAGF